ncbi:MAG: DNA-binding NtrC family response regulator, partial [Bradymonadia bacterium]
MDPLTLIGIAARIIGRAGSPATRLETVVDRLAEEGVRVSVWRRAAGGIALVAGLHSGEARVAAQAAMQGETSANAVVARVGGLAVGALTSRAKDAALLESLAGVLAPALHRLADAPVKAPARLLGRSKAIEGVQDQITRVAASEATVLLRGESGVGKELVARGI